MASFSNKGEPIGIVPPVTRSPTFVPIPEDKLKVNQKYLIETNTYVFGKHFRRRYEGVLDTLKVDNCYKFKYLKDLNEGHLEKIDHDSFSSDNGPAFIKKYDAPLGGDILTVEQLESMEPSVQLDVGNTYYVLNINEFDETDVTAFRGIYTGSTNDGNDGDDDINHVFSNIVFINEKRCFNNNDTITFYYTVADLIEYDRQRRLFGDRIPYGEVLVDDPSRRYGGDKRKTNKRKTNKRKTNKRKTNKRKINKRKTNR